MSFSGKQSYFFYGNIGFRDDIIYKYLEGKNKDLINLKQMDRDECIEAFNEYSKNNGTIY